jgi:kynurenine formamidase
MCSPEIMARVAKVSRRSFVRRSGALSLAAGAATLGSVTVPVRAQDATPMASPIAMNGPFSSIIDLSHTWHEDFPMYPGAQQPAIDVLKTIAKDFFYKNQLTIDEHTGTHLDAPAHFADGGMTAELLPPENFIAPLVVIDITDRAASDLDAQGMPDDIMAWESEHGPLPEGAFVALNSGWAARVDDPQNFINLDANNVAHFPGWHPYAAAMLVNERSIVGIGVDTLSLDYGASADFATHLTVLPAGKYGLENLNQLDAAPPTGAWIIVGGPKHNNASGGPTRAFAVM